MKWRGLVCGSAVAGLMSFSVPAHAAVIDGNLSISGAITYDTLDTTGGAILSFQPAFTSPPTAPTGPFVEVTNATGYLGALGLGLGSTGTILNLTNVTPSAVNTTFAPAGVDLTGLVDNFLNNWTASPINGGAALPNLHFDLTYIPLQGGPGCPAVPSCVEGPFILTQTANGIRIDFDVYGNFVNGADSGAYKGSFGMVINGLTLDEAGDRLTNTGLDIMCGIDNLQNACSFTANFDPVALPEPASLALFGVGSAVLAAARRRNAKKAEK